MRNLLALLFASAFLSACISNFSVEKRRYRKGFHFTSSAHQHQIKTEEVPVKMMTEKEKFKPRSFSIKLDSLETENALIDNIRVTKSQTNIIKKSGQIRCEAKIKQTKQVQIQKQMMSNKRLAVKHRQLNKTPAAALALLILFLLCVWLFSLFAQGTVNPFVIKLFKASAILLFLISISFLLFYFVSGLTSGLSVFLFIILMFPGQSLWKKQSNLIPAQF